MKLLMLISAVGLVSALPALAQGVSPSGVIFGDGRDFNQDLTAPVAPPPRQGAADAERARRAERQRQANQNFPGTGRPVAAPTPRPSAPRVNAPASAPAIPPATTPVASPVRPSAPSRPTVEPATAPAEPRAATAAPPPSPRAAPVTIQPGQSTGAARGTPASR